MKFKLFYENDELRQASLNMIADLNSLPKVESWNGYPTWDFGNNVYISLTNEPRDLEKDIILNITPEYNIWYIENIQSKNKNNGFATIALNKLISMARKNNIILRLYPKNTEKSKYALNTKQLSNWYTKYGFKPISSKYYELE